MYGIRSRGMSMFGRGSSRFWAGAGLESILILLIVHQQKQICVWARSASHPGVFFYFERLAPPGVAHLLGSVWEPLAFGLAFSARLRFGLVSYARLGRAGRWVCAWLGSCFRKLGAVSSEPLASFFGVRSRTLSAWIFISKKRLASVQGVVLFSTLRLHSPPYYACILPHYAPALPWF